ncbi:MAG: hypothetical protein QOG68_1729 [Solirubrobacteraceae bacterium]|jgi:hypothetical protein|nr:hypothetical protein [Solirubrobacteraceae bacterium]
MGSMDTLDALYTSAPILDYEDDDATERAHKQANAEYHGGPGGATLAPEAFDAAILAALIAP